MTRMVSVGVKIAQLAGLLDGRDLSDWQQTFVRSILQQSDEGRNTKRLTDRQLQIIDEIWGRHFA